MMGLLAYQELSVRKADLATATALQPTDSWLGVYLGENQRVGYLHVEEKPEPFEDMPGRRSQLTAELSLTFMGNKTGMLLTGYAWRATDQPRAQFDFRANAGTQTFRVEGGLKDKVLSANVHTGGESFPISFPVSDELLISNGVGAALRIPAMEVGATYELDSFDPMTFSAGKTRIRCIGRERLEIGEKTYDALALTMTSSGVTTHAWVSPSGEMLKVETPAGFTLVKITAEEALDESVTGSATDALLETRVPALDKKPFRDAKHMTVKIEGIELPNGLPSDDIQKAILGGMLEIIPPLAPPADQTYHESAEIIAEALRKDPLVQSEHPKIVEQAAAIVGDATDNWDKANRIYAWVYESINKTAVWSVPSALEVLTTKQGDCNEHTVLYAALARAAGIPTRIVIGVVWSDEYDGFYYHAWPEVYVGQWIWMDPTLGQPIADATHIKLLTGGIEKWPQLYPFLGQLKVKVIEIE